ncbi:MAG: Fic family protein [Planctomycetes bacterium]|nr:Fic family protein [Planctomycetota bacterium]
MFAPKFTLTPAVAKALMEVEACRQAIVRLPLTVPMLESLRKTARLLSTHFSTQIEGNRLSPSQVEDVLKGGGGFPGRQRDEAEVRNYYLALDYVTAQGRTRDRFTERIVRTIPGLVLHGRKKPTKYRDGQNVIRDGRTGNIVYLPPEAKDVPRLMKELIAWISAEMGRDELPVPVTAAVAHCQLATIHPYYDGNGRTARLLTTLILHRGGYGLHGICSLEEYYAKHLAGYYDALHVGTSHNYYYDSATCLAAALDGML